MKTVPRFTLKATVELVENFPVEEVTREAIEIMIQERLKNLRFAVMKLTDIQVLDK